LRTRRHAAEAKSALSVRSGGGIPAVLLEITRNGLKHGFPGGARARDGTLGHISGNTRKKFVDSPV